MKTIEDVLEFLNTIEYINEGGCGFSAYAIYLWLKKENKLPEDFEIVYLYWNKQDYKYNQRFISGEESTATSCTHACIYMNKKYFDSEGSVDIDDTFYRAIMSITPSIIDIFMQSSLEDEYIWNPRFDREYYVPIIEEKLGINFNIKLRSIFN